MWRASKSALIIAEIMRESSVIDYSAEISALTIAEIVQESSVIIQLGEARTKNSRIGCDYD
jgi:hypothetical protein